MLFFKNKSRVTGGFTLIELLVVIAIIGLLSTIILAPISSARMKARDVRRIADMNQIRLALEMYYDDYGYYPQSDCGWDCNGYRYSYVLSSWNALAADLAPYVRKLGVDPLNSGACPPWGNQCYTYAYGNVGRNTQRIQYDLTAQLESPTHVDRCFVKSYTFYFNNQPWCGSYSAQIYEASPN